MSRKLRTLIPALVWLVPAIALAAEFDNPLKGLGSGKVAVFNAIKAVIQFMLYIAVALAVGGIVWGGILYITSLGNDNRVKLAKTIIFSAIAGLIVIFLAQLIVNLVGNILKVQVAPGVP